MSVQNMSGPEHYMEAERLAERADHFIYGDGGDVATGHAFAVLAAVHADLARTALLVDTGGGFNTDPSIMIEWLKVSGKTP